MPRLVFDVSIDTGERFRRLSRDLKEAGNGDLQRKLRRQIRKAGKPVVKDVQQAARAVRVSSSKGGHAPPDKSTGLRDKVARATNIQITKRGIRIRVSARRMHMGEYGRTLPKYLNASGKYAEWRHPVFARKGRRRRWVKQKGEPFFEVTIRKHADDFRRAIEKAMDDVEDSI